MEDSVGQVVLPYAPERLKNYELGLRADWLNRTLRTNLTNSDLAEYITYPKDRANWVEVELTGVATVAGTESTSQAIYVLPILASDITVQTVSPPGQPSPYGDQVASCQSPK